MFICYDTHGSSAIMKGLDTGRSFGWSHMEIIKLLQAQNIALQHSQLT